MQTPLIRSELFNKEENENETQINFGNIWLP